MKIDLSQIYGIGVRSALALMLTCTGASAQPELPRPDGPVVLTVTGAISVTNANGQAEYDLAMLRALPSVSFTTSTIWTEGKQAFTGVPVAALLAQLDVDGTTLVAAAINDYSSEIPVAEIGESSPIIAYSQNGEPIPRRKKGPLWIVYPYDSNEKYRKEVVYSRSVWQLKRLEVKP